MSRTVDVFIPLDASDEPIGRLVTRAVGIAHDDIASVRVLRRSLDARKAHAIGHRVRAEIFFRGEQEPPRHVIEPITRWPSSRARPRIVIVGSGPAGTWTALRLAESGVPSTIVERGKAVQPRRHDLAKIQRGSLDEQSNYCFGEGGAGTYSDGKLYTRTKDRAAVERVLADLVRFGGPEEIAWESRPHVGSNRLPRVLTALREHLEKLGVVYRFSSRLVDIEACDGHVRSVRLSDGDEIAADVVVVTSGHSARDVYRWAAAKGIAIERKGSAVGVRLEHPQPVINRIQYGSFAGDPRLPPAFYECSATAGDRGVYSFCMCPGGFIVPAATEQEGLVVNGMSLSRRDSPYANAAIVVAVAPGDYGDASLGALAGIDFQRRIEEKAFALGGGAFRAPATRLKDFLAGKTSTSLPAVSYHPGAVAAPIAEAFPPFVASALRQGLDAVVRRMRGFLHDDAVLVGVETRTSAPVRLVRDATTLQSPSLSGLYLGGEGAGYAGGIVSAAVDGERIARAILTGAM